MPKTKIPLSLTVKKCEENKTKVLQYIEEYQGRPDYRILPGNYNNISLAGLLEMLGFRTRLFPGRVYVKSMTCYDNNREALTHLLNSLIIEDAIPVENDKPVIGLRRFEP